MKALLRAEGRVFPIIFAETASTSASRAREVPKSPASWAWAFATLSQVASKPHNDLLSLDLAKRSADLQKSPEGPAASMIWSRAEQAIDAARPDDPDIDDSEAALAVSERDAEFLAELVKNWGADNPELPVCDRAILKRAMKAFRKRLKVTRLDDESTLGGAGMTSGRESSIVAVQAPDQYPAETWEMLANLGRLRRSGHGMYEILDG